MEITLKILVMSIRPPACKVAFSLLEKTLYFTRSASTSALASQWGWLIYSFYNYCLFDIFRVSQNSHPMRPQFEAPCVRAAHREQWCLKVHVRHVHIPSWNLWQKRGDVWEVTLWTSLSFFVIVFCCSRVSNSTLCPSVLNRPPKRRRL